MSYRPPPFLTVYERKKFQDRKAYWMKKGCSEKDAFEKAMPGSVSDIRTPVLAPVDTPQRQVLAPVDTPQRQVLAPVLAPEPTGIITFKNRVSEFFDIVKFLFTETTRFFGPVISYLYPIGVRVFRQFVKILLLTGVTIGTTFLLMVESTAFFRQAHSPFPGLWALMIETGMLVAAFMSPGFGWRGDWEEKTKTVLVKLLQCTIMVYSFSIVLVRLDNDHTRSTIKIQKSEYSASEQTLIAQSLAAALASKNTAAKYGDHKAIAREDKNIKFYEQKMEQVRKNDGATIGKLVASEDRNNFSLIGSRAIILFIHVAAGSLLAGALQAPFGKTD